MKIRRRCKCGCGGITKSGNRYIFNHHAPNKGKKDSKETREKKSISMMYNTNGEGNKGRTVSKETKLKNSISHIKYNPDDPYCDIWKDGEYKKDLRKDYCENIDCKGNYKRLNNHHIDLDKKNCHPSNIMTLCVSCHSILHWSLRCIQHLLIINRSDHISYINKKTRRKIIIKRII